MSGYAEAPRTLWTMVRDALPLVPETIARGVALEQGRHPTMTALREALGLDLDFAGVWEAVRRVRLPHDAPSSDELLIEFIDEMYRGLASTRLVRVTLSDEGVTISGQDAPVRARAGERLNLLALVDNKRLGDVSVGLDAPGGGERLVVEAGRVGSVLLDAGVVEADTREVNIRVEAGSGSGTHAVVLDVAPSWMLGVRLVDDATDAEVPARVYLEDGVGPAWPDGATIRQDEHGRAFFHADGAFEVLVSGDACLVVQRGMEYEATEVTLVAPRDGRRDEIVRLLRWSDMANEGWRSADVHVHLHYGGEYLFAPEHAALVQRAEDVHFMNMMVANQGSAVVHDGAYFEGRPDEQSDGGHILRWGEEYRNDFYGHLCMYGIRELVPPIYSGFRLSEHPHDTPANAVAAERCHRVGGTLSYAHPLFGGGDLDRVFDVPRTVEAKELPVDLALGQIDALDVMSYPGVDLEVARLWYRLLNCGFRLPATAGTDTFMNFAGSGIFSNPPAGNRVFAQIDGAFTTESWCEAVRNGRTFVTNGPMLGLTVDGEAIGSELERASSAGLRIEGVARSHVPVMRIELIVNGEVAATGDVHDGGRSAALEHTLALDASCWIALRALGGRDHRVFGGELFAHTSPVYVTVGDAPVRSAEDAAYFVEWIDRLIMMCYEHGRYEGEVQRAAVIELFRKGQEYYRKAAEATAR